MHPVRIGAATLASAGLIASGAQLLTVGAAQAAGTGQQVTAPAIASGRPAVAPRAPAAAAVLVYATTDVRVRASASTSSTVLGTLPKGGHVGRRGSSVNGWTPVNYQGTDAWIYTDYLTTTKPSTGSTAVPRAVLVYATADVRVRASASTSSTVLGTLPKGGHVGRRGSSVNGWTPVNYQGTDAWIYTDYLTTTKPSTDSGGTTAPKASIVYATSWVRVRAGASTSSSILGTLETGNQVESRGSSVNGWTPVKYKGTDAWVSSDYLSTAKPATDPGNGTSGGSGNGGSEPSSWAVLMANGSSGLDGLRPSAKAIVNRNLVVFPQIKTIYGIRADSLPDHPSGHAVDLMLPHGASDMDLGWTIANYYRAHAKELGVQYIMFDKSIWNISRDSEGWRAVADRGSDTANHMDHVHITTIWD